MTNTYTVIATETYSHEGDAYNVTTGTLYKVLGTVSAENEQQAIKFVKENMIRPYFGSVIVFPGFVDEVYTGFMQ